mmetsp:Transcript_67287/g.194624  ORF Transcript_67287/g.194624 Transcript_67287/m.194624 type:complete len:247 (+) Transcript_67287:3645-4385(+)
MYTASAHPSAPCRSRHTAPPLQRRDSRSSRTMRRTCTARSPWPRRSCPRRGRAPTCAGCCSCCRRTPLRTRSSSRTASGSSRRPPKSGRRCRCSRARRSAPSPGPSPAWPATPRSRSRASRSAPAGWAAAARGSPWPGCGSARGPRVGSPRGATTPRAPTEAGRGTRRTGGPRGYQSHATWWQERRPRRGSRSSWAARPAARASPGPRRPRPRSRIPRARRCCCSPAARRRWRGPPPRARTSTSAR